LGDAAKPMISLVPLLVKNRCHGVPDAFAGSFSRIQNVAKLRATRRAQAVKRKDCTAWIARR